MIMKRMDKVESLIGKIIFKENGEVIQIREENIVEQYKASKNGNVYTVYELISGEFLYFRNTKACTYYELLEFNSREYTTVDNSTVEDTEEPVLTSVEEQACTIVDEIFAEIIDWNTIDLTELSEVDVTDFYYKGFNKHYVIENETSLCIGFGVEGSGDIYIPIEPIEVGERCSIVKESDVKPYITQDMSFLSDLCKLGYSDKIYNPDNNEVRVWYKDAVLDLNKKTCERIVSEHGIKGFLVGNEYIFVEKISSPLIDFYIAWKQISEEFDGLIESEPDIYKMVYKKYISKKKTNGISNRVSNSMFEYLKY